MSIQPTMDYDRNCRETQGNYLKGDLRCKSGRRRCARNTLRFERSVKSSRVYFGRLGTPTKKPLLLHGISRSSLVLAERVLSEFCDYPSAWMRAWEIILLSSPH